MTAKIYRVQDDVSAPSVTATLTLDDSPVDLTGATIACYLRERSTGAVVTISGLTGSSVGVVTTPLTATTLATAGTYTLEWEITDPAGATYPASGADRPLLIIREETA